MKAQQPHKECVDVLWDRHVKHMGWGDSTRLRRLNVIHLWPHGSRPPGAHPLKGVPVRFDDGARSRRRTVNRVSHAGLRTHGQRDLVDEPEVGRADEGGGRVLLVQNVDGQRGGGRHELLPAVEVPPAVLGHTFVICQGFFFMCVTVHLFQSCSTMNE